MSTKAMKETVIPRGTNLALRSGKSAKCCRPPLSMPMPNESRSEAAMTRIARGGAGRSTARRNSLTTVAAKKTSTPMIAIFVYRAGSSGWCTTAPLMRPAPTKYSTYPM
ncbi:hypothetical protein ACRJ4W_10165 [Streptomyces sp. GLT-R25]